jgi:hypothetical protein
MSSNITLRELRSEYGRRRFVAMPIAGAIGWSAAGVLGALLPTGLAALSMFICVGMIFWLGVLVGHLVGEPILGTKRKKSELDQLFMLTVLMAWLVFAIAIPFYLVEPTSLPLSLGVLAGLMWVPFSWMIQHWVGLFHGITRTVLVVAAWYVYPDHRFVVIPGVIVFIYAITIYVLATRPLPPLDPVSVPAAPDGHAQP